MTATHFGDRNNGRLPIHDLVETRLKELGIQRSEFARRCGFKNVAKGIRRIEAMCAGDLVSLSAKMILKALPAALEVSEEIADGTVRETAVLLEQNERRAAADRDAAWRASFKPKAYFVGQRRAPPPSPCVASPAAPNDG
jgi:hypothetical protein